MKVINITSLLVVAAISFLSNVAVSATEHSDEVTNAVLTNLRHLATGEKPVKGETAKNALKSKGVK